MRFAVISDTHFYAGGNGRDGAWWNRTLASRSLEIGRCLAETLKPFSPDFVIHCGDLIGTDRLDDWEAGMDIMERLGCTWYGAIGNHETWNPGVRAAFAARFGLPGDRCYYAKTLGGIRFVFLDTCHWRSADGACSPYLDRAQFDAGEIEGLALPEEELAWLDGELRAADLPVCLVSHAPLGFKPLYPAATRPKGRPAEPGGTPFETLNDRAGKLGDVVNRAEVRRVVARHGCVKAAFAGHAHINDLHREDGIAFCMTGAMREYPFEFRLAEVEKGAGGAAMRVATRGLRDGRYARESFVPEWDNRWVAGAEANRNFTIPL